MYECLNELKQHSVHSFFLIVDGKLGQTNVKPRTGKNSFLLMFIVCHCENLFVLKKLFRGSAHKLISTAIAMSSVRELENEIRPRLMAQFIDLPFPTSILHSLSHEILNCRRFELVYIIDDKSEEQFSRSSKAHKTTRRLFYDENLFVCLCQQCAVFTLK